MSFDLSDLRRQIAAKKGLNEQEAISLCDAMERGDTFIRDVAAKLANAEQHIGAMKTYQDSLEARIKELEAKL